MAYDPPDHGTTTTLAMAERITAVVAATTTSHRTGGLGLLMNAVARMNENLRAMIDGSRIGVSQVSCLRRNCCR